MTVKLRRIDRAALLASKTATVSSTMAAAIELQCSAVPQDRQTSNHIQDELSTARRPHRRRTLIDALRQQLGDTCPLLSAPSADLVMGGQREIFFAHHDPRTDRQ